jgi:hypothetical protein
LAWTCGSQHDESRLEIFDGDGHLFRLVSEAHRIRLAHLFDPVLAVHTSLVEPLSHKKTAVYEAMLSRQPLRFLLADDLGAGKTIITNPNLRRGVSRRLAQAAAKKSWENRDLPNWLRIVRVCSASSGSPIK